MWFHDNRPTAASSRPGGDRQQGSGRMLDDERRSQLSTVLTVVLAVALALAVAATVYIALFPPETSEPFTEYYLIGPDGNASGYPTDLEPGASGVVVVGITNQEQETVDYRSDVAWNGTVRQSYDATLSDGETQETRLRLEAPAEPGRYNVSFLLYKGDSETAEERLRLWVTVGNESGS